MITLRPRSRLVLASFALAACGESASTPPVDVTELPPAPRVDARFDPRVAVVPSRTPPALSGGTLAITPSGEVVASDPDRDQVYLIDLGASRVDTIALTEFDEPGRLIANREAIYVALRGADAVARIDLRTHELVRTQVCSAPRGLTFRGASAVLVACADGQLVTLGLDGVETGRTFVADDLRDVGSEGDGIWVSRYRSAELLHLDANLAIVRRERPVDFTTSSFDAAGEPSLTSATLAARTVTGPEGRPLMLHQRATASQVETDFGGYGGESPECDSPIVHATLSWLGGESITASRILPRAVVPTDVAVAPRGDLIAVVAPGSFATQRVEASPAFEEFGSTKQPTRQLALLSRAAMAQPASTEKPCAHEAPQAEHLFPGEATAVAFVDDRTMVVQVREPAELRVFSLDDEGIAKLGKVMDLSTRSVLHTGHQIFHQNAGLGVACASCHGEAHDDGHVWDFARIGPRRTQTLLHGVLDSAPFHWDGDMHDLRTLMNDVFSQRMGGDVVSETWLDALAVFLHALPERVHAARVDPEAAVRGRAVFEAAECATCHAGKDYGGAGAFDVGTGGTFQVPSLIGVSERLPVMHDGCADTLEKRFDPTCGGSAHGAVDTLSDAERADLVSFLSSL